MGLCGKVMNKYHLVIDSSLNELTLEKWIDFDQIDKLMTSPRGSINKVD